MIETLRKLKSIASFACESRENAKVTLLITVAVLFGFRPEKFPENRFELTALERQLRIPIDSCSAVKQAMKAWRNENGKADGSAE